MGERADEERPGERRPEDVRRGGADLSPENPGGPTAREVPAYGSSAEDAAAIERDIDRTRAEMSETIDAIGERLNPDHIKQQAKDSIQNTAREAKSTMMETIRQNPVPALIAGLSVGWLIRKGSDGSSRRAAPQAYSQRPGFYRAEPYRETDMGTRMGHSQTESGTHSMQEQAGQATDQAQRKAQQYSDQASQKAQQYSEQASNTAQQLSSQAQQAGHQAQRQMQQVSHQAQRQARRATDRADQMLRENPLGMGVLTAAVGAAVGLALPSTRTEDELMGSTRDQVVQQAQSTAKEKMEKAQDVAEKTAEEAKETAKEEAEEQDLTS